MQHLKRLKGATFVDKPFTEKDFKVKDHNHLSGKYRGPAHRSCNFKDSISELYSSIYA